MHQNAIHFRLEKVHGFVDAPYILPVVILFEINTTFLLHILIYMNFYPLVDFLEALHEKERRRRQLPPVYNEARLSELPLPILVLPEETTETEDDPIDEQDPLASLNASIDNTSLDTKSDGNNGEIQSSSTSQVKSIESAAIANENVTKAIGNVTKAAGNAPITNKSDPIAPPVNIQSAVVSTSVQTPTPIVSVIPLDVNQAIATTSRESHEQSRASTSSMLADESNAAMDMTADPIKSEPVFEQLNESDSRAAEEVFNDSFENYGSDDDVMIHRRELVPKPIADKNSYEVKSNDLLSGNIPFAQNEAGDRSYIVSEGSVWKPVTLTQRIVKGLKLLNMESSRHDAAYDKKFLKVLIVGIIGLTQVKANNMDSLKVDFIKGLLTNDNQ